MQCQPIWTKFCDFNFAAARSAAPGDDFTAIFSNYTPS